MTSYNLLSPPTKLPEDPGTADLEAGQAARPKSRVRRRHDLDRIDSRLVSRARDEGNGRLIAAVLTPLRLGVGLVLDARGVQSRAACRNAVIVAFPFASARSTDASEGTAPSLTVTSSGVVA